MPDNWIYIHEPGVQVGRIFARISRTGRLQWFPIPQKHASGWSTLFSENDILWSSPDDKLIELAKKEIEQLGLVPFLEEIEDGKWVVTSCRRHIQCMTVRMG